MNNETLHLLISLSCGLVLLIFGFIFLKLPPKSINSFYGYRTKRSMQNQDTWESAHQHASYWMMRFGVLTMLVSIAVFVLLPAYNILISLVAMGLMLIAIIPITEKHLKQRYDKDGNPKSIVDSYSAVSSKEQESE